MEKEYKMKTTIVECFYCTAEQQFSVEVGENDFEGNTHLITCLNPECKKKILVKTY